MKFRKKPVIVEAVKLTKETIQECYDFVGAKGNFPECGMGIDPLDGQFKITTLEGVMVAQLGDWIIKGVKGECYPCKPDIFAQTYLIYDEHAVELSSSGPYGLLHLGRGSFGEAVYAAKQGKKVARKGWNGKGMYAVIMPGYPDGVEVNEVTQKAHNLPAGTKLIYRPYWQLYTAQCDVAMWAPSGSDSLAEDWCLYDDDIANCSIKDPLSEAPNHPLNVLLERLKFGRPASNQNLLDKWIEECNELSISTSGLKDTHF